MTIDKTIFLSFVNLRCALEVEIKVKGILNTFLSGSSTVTEDVVVDLIKTCVVFVVSTTSAYLTPGSNELELAPDAGSLGLLPAMLLFGKVVSKKRKNSDIRNIEKIMTNAISK